jgi:hypothetical protein
MKITIRELMCAAALGAFAMGAQAQTSDTMKPGAGTRLDATAKAEADYKVAKDACDAKSAAEKPVCLKDVMAAHDRALNAAKQSSGGTKSSY